MLESSLKFLPIGVFDSGMGGLTVLKELYKVLPNENYIYFADTQNLPYGDKSPQEICHFAEKIIKWFTAQKVKMIIVACNTSSAIAFQQQNLNNPIPILTIIDPIAQSISPLPQKLGIMATQRTIESMAYQRAFQQYSPSLQVYAIACPEFVPIIENNKIYEEASKLIIKDYLYKLLYREIDTLLFGCTHYPLLKPVIETLLPQEKKIRYADPAYYSAQKAKEILETSHLLNKNKGKKNSSFYVSGSPQDFQNKATHALGFKINAQKAEIFD